MKKYLIKKLNSLRKYVIKRSYSLWYGVEFKSGYSYKMIKNSNLDLLERHHYIMLDLGWERCTDVKANFFNAWCWYNKKSQ
jgi:hypothetical protein